MAADKAGNERNGDEMVSADFFKGSEWVRALDTHIFIGKCM